MPRRRDAGSLRRLDPLVFFSDILIENARHYCCRIPERQGTCKSKIAAVPYFANGYFRRAGNHPTIIPQSSRRLEAVSKLNAALDLECGAGSRKGHWKLFIIKTVVLLT
jgi:hypothetical protein